MTAREEVKVRFVRSPAARPPVYAHDGDAGADLCSAQDALIQPGTYALVGTGLRLALPEGYEAQVRPRSGLALEHGITVLNTPGTVDAGYRGEIKVILLNLGKKPFKVEPGMRIAQLVLQKVPRGEFIEVKELDQTTRNDKGYGSTGTH